MPKTLVDTLMELCAVVFPGWEIAPREDWEDALAEWQPENIVKPLTAVDAIEKWVKEGAKVTFERGRVVCRKP